MAGFNSSDIFAVEQMYDQNGLTKGDKNDPTTWDFVTWTAVGGEYRILELNINSMALRGNLDVSLLTQMQKLDCEGNVLTGINVSNLANFDFLSQDISTPTSTPTPTSAPTVRDFTISAKAEGGCSINANGSIGVANGQDFTFYFTANEGYRLGKVVVDGKTAKTDGKAYTFRNISENHTITAVFTKGGIAPQTSDSTNIVVFVVILVIAIAVVGVVLLLRFKKSRKS